MEEGWGEGHRKEGGGWGRRTLVKGNVIKVSVCVKTKLIDIRGGKGRAYLLILLTMQGSSYYIPFI